MPDEPVGIGRYYQFLGGFLIVAMIGIQVIREIHGSVASLYSVIGSGLLLLGGVAMLLPDTFKSIIAAIPWTKYTGDPK